MIKIMLADSGRGSKWKMSRPGGYTFQMVKIVQGMVNNVRD